MPKKKIQNKGKTKHAVEESENEPYSRKLSENVEDKFTTVTDYETNKFNKRLIENNWAKYEPFTSEFDSDEESEAHNAGDFDFLIKTASSDCSHFQFSSEKQWKHEDNSVPPSEIFNLDLDVLSKGLGCLPFYERIGMKEIDLSEEDKKCFDKAAAKSKEEYVLFKDFKELGGDLKSKGDRTLTDSGGETNKVVVKSNDDNVKTSIKSEDKTNEEKQGNEPKSTKKAFLSENEENLEDWLDSVLGD